MDRPGGKDDGKGGGKGEGGGDEWRGGEGIGVQLQRRGG